MTSRIITGPVPLPAMAMERATEALGIWGAVLDYRHCATRRTIQIARSLMVQWSDPNQGPLIKAKKRPWTRQWQNLNDVMMKISRPIRMPLRIYLMVIPL